MPSFFSQFSKPLVILDLANNHNGNLDHAKRIIEEASEVMRPSGVPFAIKFQYRNLDTFIHDDFKGNHDFPYIKRFESTRLDWDQFKELVDFIRFHGGLAACTPFDEISVEMVEKHEFDILKIASASFTDWPLLERVAKSELPIVASTAGAAVDDIDRVASFLSHREKDFALMHCVAAYPTRDDDLQLNRIDMLRNRYRGIPIGYSTHESPKNVDAVKIAIAKGASILERHIGVATSEVGLNAYSSSPELLSSWLNSIEDGLKACGRLDGHFPTIQSEQEALYGLRRGVFVKRDVAVGETIKDEDVRFAIPLLTDQLSANDWSKYRKVTTQVQLKAGSPLLTSQVNVEDSHAIVNDIVQRSRTLFKESHVVVPNRAELEISHHYGLEKFNEFGLVMVTVVNRDYCKKLLLVFPGQQHPEQWHNTKEETFNCLFGELELRLDGEWQTLHPGDSIVVKPGVRHFFTSRSGCVFEEISSTHQVVDSFYTDEAITKNPHRKTFVGFWS
jgi:sialic acid synthase SpsE/D-lyxose ketol-isomerase